jgi:hypothetical protein
MGEVLQKFLIWEKDVGNASLSQEKQKREYELCLKKPLNAKKAETMLAYPRARERFCKSMSWVRTVRREAQPKALDDPNGHE